MKPLVSAAHGALVILDGRAYISIFFARRMHDYHNNGFQRKNNRKVLEARSLLE
jgi:hypothetical protein